MGRWRGGLICGAVLLCCAAGRAAVGDRKQVGALRSKLSAEALSSCGSDEELRLWLRETRGDVGRAVLRIEEKAAFKERIGRVTVRDVARVFGTDGYTVYLGGLRDRAGSPLVFSRGIPRGTERQIARQTIWLQDRILEDAATPGAPWRPGRARPPARAVTIIDVRSPSFRVPDPALRAGGIETIRRYYPWANRGTTIFVGVPPAVRQFVALASKFFPTETAERFCFADDLSARDLSRWIAPANLPREWGGTADWSLRRYTIARAVREGTFCVPPSDVL